jgi:DNA modification methylase
MNGPDQPLTDLREMEHTPFYTDDWLTLYGGDCRSVLASLPADSVDCVVTSPPYWGLRDYGNDGQLGLERTPEEYVANMVAVFAEVRRVLKPSGTCWLNLGDSYSSTAPNTVVNAEKMTGKHANRDVYRRPDTPLGLKPKDLVGIPWRVAFALQADGWYLRSDIIWSKPNPMPESVTDRPTKSHEYLFLLTKSARYYFDADAVREAHAPSTVERGHLPKGRSAKEREGRYGMNNIAERSYIDNPAGRNIRSVWNIATRPYPGAHFAVFPPELPERCIKAGSSERGVCPECGAPWERVVERGERIAGRIGTTRAERAPDDRYGEERPDAWQGGQGTFAQFERNTTGWQPSCDHSEGRKPIFRNADGSGKYGSLGYNGEPYTPTPAVVLDPFGGSGTVGMVANRLSRRAILIDLNPEYLEQQMRRNAQTPLGLTEGDAA